MTRPEPVVDLPLWRLRKLAGRLLRQLAPAPPPLPATLDPKIVPFRRAGHRRSPSRRNPQ